MFCADPRATAISQKAAVRKDSMLKNGIGFCLAIFSILLFVWPVPSEAQSWTKLTNRAPAGAGTILQLTDGTIMVESGSQKNWMRLTPDAQGSYVNGIWTQDISPMSTGRLYFTSQVLPSGKVWVLGGEYSGLLTEQQNWTPTGEIFDPVANSWSAIMPYPSQSNCPLINYTTGNTAAGSPIITGIPNTTGFQVGWTISGTGIPVNTTIASVDSPSQIHISQNAIATNAAVPLQFNGFFRLLACFGDDPSMLLPGEKILAGNLINNSSYIYNIATDTWAFAANKVYADRSDEEGWVKLPDGTVLTYDIFKSIAANNGYAERYDPRTNTWSSISPADGSANGVLPVLSSGSLGDELGPLLRLEDGRVFVIGANGHTARYTPSTNTWDAGPDLVGTLGGSPFLFGADDAPAALMPNGHVLLAADAGPGLVLTGNTTNGSNIITEIPSTASLQTGWLVSGVGIPSVPLTFITSVDSSRQIHISQNATATNISVALKFGSTFSRPTQLFDFDPDTGVIAPVSPAIPDPLVSEGSAFITRMLVLPTGQILFSDSSDQLWVYTPNGPVNPVSRPVVNQVAYDGGGLFTLTGKQLNGQSAGSSYGDDVQDDENYPIIRLTSSSGNVYYCRTTNWSTVGVAGGTALETVNFTLNPALPAGNYAVIVSGAGISSFPLFVNISQSEVNGL